eukprot:Lithocolla_globosa_v1_NODE_1954_length_2242_cov_6.186100.p1 type:complete len:326 gc:universal NODE_1954_length_2242_cov_6.186100:1055-2032(+)
MTRGRTTPISLRWTVVYMFSLLGLTFAEIEHFTLVPESTSCDIVGLYQRTGDVEPGTRFGRPRDAMDEEMQLIFMTLQDNPTLFLDELQDIVSSITGHVFSIPTLFRCLRRLGITRKKLKYFAQRQDILHQAFFRNIMHQLVTNLNQLIFVDETGVDLRSTERLYGYSVRGVPVSRRHAYMYKGRRHSSIAALNISGIVGLKVIEGTNNALTFMQFIDEEILPILQPYPLPNSIVVLDNAAIHHVAIIAEMIESYGAFLIFLPPYSPILNPIEEIFALVKKWLQRNQEFVLDEYTNRGHIRYALNRAFVETSSEVAYNVIAHAGY